MSSHKSKSNQIKKKIDISLIIDDSHTAKFSIDINNTSNEVWLALTEEISRKFDWNESVKSKLYLQLKKQVIEIKRASINLIKKDEQLEKTFNRWYYQEMNKKKKREERYEEILKQRKEKEICEFSFTPDINTSSNKFYRNNFTKVENRWFVKNQYHKIIEEINERMNPKETKESNHNNTTNKNTLTTWNKENNNNNNNTLISNIGNVTDNWLKQDGGSELEENAGKVMKTVWNNKPIQMWNDIFGDNNTTNIDAKKNDINTITEEVGTRKVNMSRSIVLKNPPKNKGSSYLINYEKMNKMNQSGINVNSSINNISKNDHSDMNWTSHRKFTTQTKGTNFRNGLGWFNLPNNIITENDLESFNNNIESFDKNSSMAEKGKTNRSNLTMHRAKKRRMSGTNGNQKNPSSDIERTLTITPKPGQSSLIEGKQTQSTSNFNKNSPKKTVEPPEATKSQQKAIKLQALDSDIYTFKPTISKGSLAMMSKRNETPELFINRLTKSRWINNTEQSIMNIRSQRQLHSKQRSSVCNTESNVVRYSTKNKNVHTWSSNHRTKTAYSNNATYSTYERRRIKDVEHEKEIEKTVNGMKQVKQVINDYYMKKTNSNRDKFKLNQWKRIYEVLCVQDNKLDFNSLTEEGIPEHIQKRVVMPTCWMINDKKLEFNFQNFYLIANEIWSNYF